MDHKPADRIQIQRMQSPAEAEQCASMMVRSEPWMTLGRDYQTSLNLLTHPAREVYVATLDQEIVGFIMLLMQGAFVGYVQSICVAPAWRSQGIGEHLMTYAEQRIFQDSPNVFICVSSFNTRAQQFYERCGYAVVGVLNDYLVTGYDEILLRKTIGPLASFRA